MERLPADILSRRIGSFLLDDEMFRLAWSSPTITSAVHPGWSSSPYPFQNQFQNDAGKELWCLYGMKRVSSQRDQVALFLEFYDTRSDALEALKGERDGWKERLDYYWKNKYEITNDLTETEENDFLNGASGRCECSFSWGDNTFDGRIVLASSKSFPQHFKIWLPDTGM